MRAKEPGLQNLKNGTTPLPPSLPLRETAPISRLPQGEEESLGLGTVAGVLRRQVIVIATIAAIITSASIFLNSTRRPEYQGKFQILVEPLKTSDSELLVLLSETLKQNVNEITRNNTTALDYQALMQVLRSPQLMDPVVRNLQTRYPKVTYGSLVGYEGGAAKPGQLNITRIAKGKDESRVIEVNYQDSDPKKVKMVLEQVSQAYLKYSLEQQKTGIRQGIKFVNSQVPALQERVSILQKEMQAFQQRYGVINPQVQGDQLVKRLDEIQAQRLETQKKLAESRTLYASLQNQVGMQPEVAIAASALSESPQYQQLMTRLREIDAKLATESSRFSDENPVILSLRDQRAKLLPLLAQERQLALGNRVSASNPQTLAFQNSTRRELTQKLAASANEIKSLESSYQASLQAENLLNQQIKNFPVIARRYSDLQRDLQVATDTLNQVLAKREVLRVDAAQQEVPWELIMRPTLPQDKTGKYLAIPDGGPRNILLGGVAGLLVGALAGFGIEKLKNVFYTTEELKAATKLPILGVIPFNPLVKKHSFAGDVVVVNEQEHQKLSLASDSKARQYEPSPFLQSFNSLYSKIKFLKSDNPVRSIAVTSATTGEGKSTVAAYLAQMAAHAGQRVLLVDANLRHPQIHLRIGVANNQGLTEVLSAGLDLSEAIVQSPSEENLFVLTSGQQPLNPAKLFSSKKMQNLVERAEANFDLVVYDTPHLLGILDSNLVANHIDGLLLVAGLGKTNRPIVKQAVNESKASRIPILGMVANTMAR
jgi:capsular exopolysaccharide synthesis family protein